MIPLGGNLPNDATSYEQLLTIVRRNEHYRQRGTGNHHHYDGDWFPDDPKSQANAWEGQELLPSTIYHNWDAERAELQSLDDADSESSCSQCSFTSLPQDIDTSDMNAVWARYSTNLGSTEECGEIRRAEFPRTAEAGPGSDDLGWVAAAAATQVTWGNHLARERAVVAIRRGRTASP